MPKIISEMGNTATAGRGAKAPVMVERNCSPSLVLMASTVSTEATNAPMAKPANRLLQVSLVYSSKLPSPAVIESASA